MVQWEKINREVRETSFIRFILAVLLCLRLMPGPLITLPEKPGVTMTFVGDCTISTMEGSFKQGSFNWYTTNHEPTYFLEKVAPIFEDDDITVVNCETVLSDRKLPKRDKGTGTAYWFTGPASNAKIFSSSSVEVAGFANNHMNDYGKDGVSDTIDALEAEGITVAKDGVPVYVTKNGITVGILACQLWYGGAERTIYKALEEMTENSDYQVIYPHGGTENVYYIDEWRTAAFHNLIDRGADLIVGTHAHRLQPIERYKNGTIVYGLGNFCFGGNVRPQNRTAIYQCTIELGEGGEISFEDSVIPCYVYTGSSNNWQPCPVEESDPVYQRILDYMNGDAETPE